MFSIVIGSILDIELKLILVLLWKGLEVSKEERNVYYE